MQIPLCNYGGRMNFTNIPKIELHCHLDGSMSVEVLQKLLTDNGEEIPIDELKNKIMAPDNCQSLAEYLDKFTIPIKVLQTAHSLEEAAYDLAKNAAKENVRYIETRFAPTSHISKGMKITDIIESARVPYPR